MAYADDTILFTSADTNSLRMMKNVLGQYEKCSGKLINVDKSAFYVHVKTDRRWIKRIKRITTAKQGNFPFMYLGCPIFYRRNKIAYFDSYVTKIRKKMHSWQGRILSFGGRAVLI